MAQRIFFSGLMAALLSVPVLAPGDLLPPSKSDNLEDFERLREEELNRTLTSLIARCKKMFDVQLAISRQHLALVQELGGRKPNRQQQRALLRLSADEGKIVMELTALTQMLENAGAAVAFPEVFAQVREDAKLAQCRLKLGYLDEKTLMLEQDIADTFHELIRPASN
jgi:hypothetical protein